MIFKLIADRTETVLATGTYEQCQFAMQAMLAYGIASDRLVIIAA